MNIRIVKSIGCTLLLVLLTLESVYAQPATDEQSFTLALKEIQVYQVQGSRPYIYTDKENKKKEIKTAYLVKFIFETKPEPTSLGIDFYIGEYKIPEYGSTSNGIYFRLIEPGLIDKLNNQEISYQIAKQKASLKKNFVKPDLKSMKPQAEKSVLKEK